MPVELGHVGGIVFMAAWVTGVVSWLLAVGEAIGVWRFRPRAFRLGPVLFRESRALPIPHHGVPHDVPFDTQSGRFKLLDPSTCLFRPRAEIGVARVRTPFAIRGTVRWHGRQCEIEARAPLFPSVFLVAWLVGWTTGGALFLFAPNGLAVGLPMLLGGCAFAALLVKISLRVEIPRARRILEELEQKLNEARPA